MCSSIIDTKIIKWREIARFFKEIRKNLRDIYKKKRAADYSVALRRGRLPTLPLSQYHRRGEA